MALDLLVMSPLVGLLPSQERKMPAVKSPGEIAASLTELWSPRIIGEVDDNFIKVAKVQGVFGWHAHPGEDELFFILKGRLRIEMEDGTVEIGEGQCFVVPKGVRHNPSADEECHLMLIEKKSTLHTGDVVTERTRSIEDQLRPVAGMAGITGRRAEVSRQAHAGGGASADIDVQRVELSALISKYIGETEKNIDRLFAKAEESGAVLLFDEADALFGKRSEVRDAHDRYANIEVSYLLQKIQAHPGPVMFANKRKQDIDEAFMRRLRFQVT
jgi:mannose-6-phosphate isomerase-like protein (cupin superfamily)